MNALVWTEPKKMEYKEVSYPTAQPGWVILKVEAVGICGSELSGYLGHNSLRTPPLVMGHEFSGVVVEVGENSPKSLINQIVTVNPLMSCGQCRCCLTGNRQLCHDRKIIGVNYAGAFAEYVSVPASQCYPVSDPRHSAMAEPLACSLRAVNRARVEAGDIGIVIGAGIIGLMAMKLMKLRGARQVYAIDTNPVRLESALLWGATHILNPKEADCKEAVRSAHPEGVDCVVDAVGFSQTRQQAIDFLRRGGRAVYIGLHEDETTLAGNSIVRDEIEVAGTFCYTDQEFSRSIDLIEDGFTKIGEDKWFDVRPLRDGDDAFQEQIFGNAYYSKILLIP